MWSTRPSKSNVVSRGREAVIRYVERWFQAWQTFSGEVEEVVSAPEEDRAFVAVRLRGKGEGSGVKIDDRIFWAYELRGGRLYRISESNDRAEALDAAGLSE